MISIIDILFDEDAKEADVELKSNDICIRCYFHPVENIKEIYESISNELLAFLPEEIMTSDISTPAAIKTDDSYYSYFLRGEVISENRIKIYDFVVDIGVIPKDIKVGEFVSCRCMRLDI